MPFRNKAVASKLHVRAMLKSDGRVKRLYPGDTMTIQIPAIVDGNSVMITVAELEILDFKDGDT